MLAIDYCKDPQPKTCKNGECVQIANDFACDCNDGYETVGKDIKTCQGLLTQNFV